jgi:hypothetical protein
MQIVIQGITAVAGLGILALVIYVALYIADELERTKIWELGRLIKAIVGGLVWSMIGIIVAAGLFAIAIVVRAIFFEAYFSFYILQFWAVRLGAVLVTFYLLWGLSYGNRNQLRLSLNFRRPTKSG